MEARNRITHAARCGKRIIPSCKTFGARPRGHYSGAYSSSKQDRSLDSRLVLVDGAAGKPTTDGRLFSPPGQRRPLSCADEAPLRGASGPGWRNAAAATPVEAGAVVPVMERAPSLRPGYHLAPLGEARKQHPRLSAPPSPASSPPVPVRAGRQEARPLRPAAGPSVSAQGPAAAVAEGAQPFAAARTQHARRRRCPLSGRSTHCPRLRAREDRLRACRHAHVCLATREVTAACCRGLMSARAVFANPFAVP